MDIEILLFLQTLRTQTITWLSEVAFVFDQLGFGVFAPLGFCIVIYWCCNKKIGQKLFLSFLFSLYLCNFIKCIACINRPWIREPRIKPHPRKLNTATGYSFPSAHSAAATANYGTLEREYNKTNIIFHFICPIIILGVMLARMILGYHTPQDVLCGFVIGFLSIFAASWIVEHSAQGRKAWIVPLSFLVIALATTYYLEVKSYPMNYVNGKLVVDPLKMRSDAQAATLALFVYLVTSAFERRFVNFTPPTSILGKILVFVPGFAMVGVIMKFGLSYLSKYLSHSWAFYVMWCVLIVFIVFIWPAFFCHFTKSGTNKKGKRSKKH